MNYHPSLLPVGDFPKVAACILRTMLAVIAPAKISLHRHRVAN
jgi:hypothetical protein